MEKLYKENNGFARIDLENVQEAREEWYKLQDKANKLREMIDNNMYKKESRMNRFKNRKSINESVSQKYIVEYYIDDNTNKTEKYELLANNREEAYNKFRFDTPEEIHSKKIKSIYPINRFKKNEGVNEISNIDKFKNYASDKITDLENVSMNYHDNDEEGKIVFIQDIRGFEDAKIVVLDNPDYVDNFIVLDKDNNIVIDTLMVDTNYIASQLEFKEIDRQYYNNLINAWDELNIDE